MCNLRDGTQSYNQHHIHFLHKTQSSPNPGHTSRPVFRIRVSGKVQLYMLLILL